MINDHSAPAAIDVYALLIHEPYEAPEHPVPINATVVNAKTFLHPVAPQPSGRLLYEAFAQASGRRAGELVPLSTVTAETGGLLSAYAPEWETAVNVVIELSRADGCESMPMGIPGVQLALLGQGPAGTLVIHVPGRAPYELGPADRAGLVQELQRHLDTFVGDRSLSPGC